MNQVACALLPVLEVLAASSVISTNKLADEAQGKKFIAAQMNVAVRPQLRERGRKRVSILSCGPSKRASVHDVGTDSGDSSDDDKSDVAAAGSCARGSAS